VPGRLPERWVRGKAMPMMKRQVTAMTTQNGGLPVLPQASQM
jgi:hypothetical protein